MNKKFAGAAQALLLVSSIGLAAPAHALLTLTPDAVAKGFSLSLFVDQVPSTGFCCGPLGIATNGLGQVVLQAYGNKTNSTFADVDGQHFSNALSSAPFGATSYGSSITNSGGTLYATQNDLGGVIVKLNPDGSVNSNLTGPGAGGHGIWTNPVTGHLVAATGAVINDIDPATGTVKLIANTGDMDGVSVSSDGTVVYGAGFGHVFGWNYATGAQVFDSGAIGSPDGTGVIQGNNKFSGDIVANANDGRVWLIDPTTHAVTVIAEGGSRGDYVGLDGTNGTLFLTQSDSVYRLSCGPGCSFTTPAPEPQTYMMLLAGLGIVGGLTRRRRSQVRAEL